MSPSSSLRSAMAYTPLFSLHFTSCHYCSAHIATFVAYTCTMFRRLFGTQVTPPAPILKAMPKIFGHSDKTVRSEGSSLAHALYQYLGAGIEPWLAELKPVQVKELKEVWDEMEKEGRGKGSLKPERLTRQQARDAEQNAGAGEGDEGGASATAEEGTSIVSSIFLAMRTTRSRSRTP